MKYIYLAIALVFFSCSQDIGNYDYKNLNELTIEGVSDMEIIDVYAFEDSLNISPTITGTKNEVDIKNLTYEWRLVALNANDKEEDDEKNIISREKDLRYFVTLSPQKYYGIYKITDKSTNNIYTKRFFVNVKTMLSLGWAILGEEEDGTPRLDWIHNKSETEDIILLDIWRDHKEEYKERLGRPISIEYSFVMGVGEDYRLINFEKGSYNVDDSTLLASESRNMRYRMGRIPEQVYVRALSPAIQDPNMNIFIDKHGDLYRKPFEPGSVYDTPCNSLGRGEPKFRVAPFYALYGWRGWATSSGTIIYDQDNCRFMELKNGASYPTVATFVNENKGIFESTANREMIFMETRLGNRSLAVLKDKNTQKYYVYVFSLSPYGPGQNTNTLQISYNELKGADLDNVSCFAYDKLNDYLFYAAGENVYRFRIADKGEEVAATKVLNFPGENIVKLKYPKLQAWRANPAWEKQTENHLFVVSNKVGSYSDCGVVRSFGVPMLEGNLIPKKEFKNQGFSKIVDMAFFENMN